MFLPIAAAVISANTANIAASTASIAAMSRRSRRNSQNAVPVYGNAARVDDDDPPIVPARQYTIEEMEELREACWKLYWAETSPIYDPDERSYGWGGRVYSPGQYEAEKFYEGESRRAEIERKLRSYMMGGVTAPEVVEFAGKVSAKRHAEHLELKEKRQIAREEYEAKQASEAESQAAKEPENIEPIAEAKIHHPPAQPYRPSVRHADPKESEIVMGALFAFIVGVAAIIAVTSIYF